MSRDVLKPGDLVELGPYNNRSNGIYVPFYVKLDAIQAMVAFKHGTKALILETDIKARISSRPFLKVLIEDQILYIEDRYCGDGKPGWCRQIS